MFQVNDKVVYIDNTDRSLRPSGYTYPNGKPILGVVYCVAGVTSQKFSAYPAPIPAIFITGIQRLMPDGRDIPYAAYRFRKVSEVQVENRLKREKSEHVPP